MYNYPYGDTQQLNLDWLLRSWREFQTQVENLIAPQYSDTTAYPAGSLVIHEHILYTNPAAILDGEVWNPNHWQATNLANMI